ncbi:MAG: SprB repeat-containing protein [Bacteroidota bacterium]
MRTHNNNSKAILSLITLFIFISQLLNAQTLSLQLTPSEFNGFNISCFGSQNGTIDLTVSGGIAPYTYQWSSDATTQDLSELPPGYYHVTVIDANQTTAEGEITLTEPKPIKIGLSTYKYPNGFNVSQNGSCNGNVSATVSGGVSPYTYHWNPGNQTVYNPTNLCAGIVFAEVTDNNGCNLKENTILSQTEKDSWLSSGNTNSNPASQFIGTTDNMDLVLKTNGVERMRI